MPFAIVGECPVCGEWIHEDEWDLDKRGAMVHEECKGKRYKYQQMLAIDVGNAVLNALRKRGYKIVKESGGEDA